MPAARALAYLADTLDWLNLWHDPAEAPADEGPAAEANPLSLEP